MKNYYTINYTDKELTDHFLYAKNKRELNKTLKRIKDETELVTIYKYVYKTVQGLFGLKEKIWILDTIPFGYIKNLV